MENNEWILEQIHQAYEKSDDYNTRTLLKAAQDIIKEQVKRIDQMEGEMEGTIWSPRRWSE
ncbi:hypothetical protein [Salirhabdus sp. Marseille-P4669]|uniref:hypothetical protein n=1 Tax=Salirhabdus sp. Marseille-P4669 TaxID=2042310 RepID=UPI000C7B39E4|nr:hypothetical protein [Salirhabdus sp. Marseille-P4669]